MVVVRERKRPHAGRKLRASAAGVGGDDKTKKGKRHLRLRVYIAAVLLLTTLFVLSALASEYIVAGMNSQIDERSRASKVRGGAADSSADAGTQSQSKGTEEGVKSLDPGFGDVHIAPASDGTTQADAAVADNSETINTKDGRKGQCERDDVGGCKDSEDTAEGDSLVVDKEVDREGLWAADAGQGVEKWTKESDLEALEKKVGMPLPNSHRSLDGADASKCPFAHGYKKAPTRFLVDIESPEYKQEKADHDNLTGVQPLVEGYRPSVAPVVALKSGHKMPIFGYGTYGIARRPGLAMMKTALSLGIRMFETGHNNVYYSTEALGHVLRDRPFEMSRKELFITLKIDAPHYRRDTFRTAVEESMTRLGLEYIDLLVLTEAKCGSKCDKMRQSDLGPWQDAWKAAIELRDAGVIHDLGVGAFSLAEIGEAMAMSDNGVSVVQRYFDPFHQDREVRDFCTEKGILYHGQSTLGSFWTVADETLAGNPVLNNDVIVAIAKKHNVSAATIALTWSLDSGVVVSPATNTLEHLQENIKSLDISLDDDEISAISALDGEMERRFKALSEDLEAERERDILSGIRSSLELRIDDVVLTPRGKIGSGRVKKAVKPSERVLLVSTSSKKSTKKTGGRLVALDLETGEERWSFSVNGGLFGAPSVSADRSTVYFATADRHAYALSASDASLRWEYTLNRTVAATLQQDNDGHVFVLDMGGNVHMLNGETGERVRHNKYTDAGIFTSTIDTKKKLLYVSTLQRRGANLFVVDYTTGEVQYELPMFGYMSNPPVLSPDGRYVFASGAGLTDKYSRVCGISTRKQKRVWSKTLGVSDENSPALTMARDGKLVFATHNTGLMLWLNATKGRIVGNVHVGEGPVIAAPIQLADETTLLVASGDGWLYTVCTKRKRYFELVNLKKPIIQTPLVDGDLAYVVSRDGTLWKIDIPTGKIVWKKVFKKETFYTPAVFY